jgi:hypothetical protein
MSKMIFEMRRRAGEMRVLPRRGAWFACARVPNTCHPQRDWERVNGFRVDERVDSRERVNGFRVDERVDSRERVKWTERRVDGRGASVGFVWTERRVDGRERVGGFRVGRAGIAMSRK